MAKRILVVEDDQPTRDFYVDLLTQEGYQVKTAKDGQEGLAKILEGGWGLILLDIIMPKLDGLGVLKALRTQKPRSPNGPIVVLTVVIHEHVAKQALKLGAVDYWTKTGVTPPELISKIRLYLNENHKSSSTNHFHGL